MRSIFPHITYAILSLHSVKYWISRAEIKHPEIVLSQVFLETLYLKCKNCSLSEKNNLFGFTTNEIKYFDHWSESIIFYKGWQKGYQGYSEEDYYEYLRKNWRAPNMDEYISKLKWIKLNIIAINKNKTK